MERLDTVCRGETVRIDVFTAKTAEITRSRAAGLIAGGNVLINGKSAAKNAKVKDGILANVAPSPPKIMDLPQPEEMTGNNLIED